MLRPLYILTHPGPLGFLLRLACSKPPSVLYAFPECVDSDITGLSAD